MENQEIIANIKGLTSDSRMVKEGYLFAALPGTRFDGRHFMDDAMRNGATHILALPGTKFPGGVTGITDARPRKRFAQLVAGFYQLQPKHVVAITGTNGKTSTADFILQIWQMVGLKSASLGTLGLIGNMMHAEGLMTTLDPVRLHGMLADLKSVGVDHLAMEASSHGLDQSRLDGVAVSVAAYTNLSQDHLDYHGDIDSYFMAKTRLFNELLPAGGTAVINIDDEYGLRLSQNIAQPQITYGTNAAASLRLITQEPHADGQDLHVNFDGQDYHIHLSLMGLFQAYNVLCAAACCMALGDRAEDIFPALEKLHGVRGRLQKIAVHDDGAAAYIDYAHTPDALAKVLSALQPHVRGRLICVFGAGGDRDKGKRPQMGRVVAAHADYAIVTDDNPRSEAPASIRADILSAFPDAENIGDRRLAIQTAVSYLKAGDVLLVAGKGHEQGQIIGDQIFPFDDSTETCHAMEARKK